MDEAVDVLLLLSVAALHGSSRNPWKGDSHLGPGGPLGGPQPSAAQSAFRSHKL